VSNSLPATRNYSSKAQIQNANGIKTSHPCVDAVWKLIWGYVVTTAKVHESVPYLDVLPAQPQPGCKRAYSDSAYSGKAIAEELLKRGYEAQICEKGYRNKPLTEEQKASNRTKSKVRCRIEYVFGEQKMRMKNETLRSIGFARAKFWIGMRNLGSNISRYLTLKKVRKSELGRRYSVWTAQISRQNGEK
jgi:IS5 family transposase